MVLLMVEEMRFVLFAKPEEASVAFRNATEIPLDMCSHSYAESDKR